jgi:alpha-methylacyl-CoA racemase
MSTAPPPLSGIHAVCLGVNLPMAAVGLRLGELGASVTKIEPPHGDPMEAAAPGLYGLLTRDQNIVRLDLKDEAGRARLHDLLAAGDALVTTSRPAALERLGLGRPQLAERHARLVQVAIVGQRRPRQNVAGHDLTYVAPLGLVEPPALPATLAADLGGAERAVSCVAALLLARERGGGVRYAEVALAESAAFFALPLEHGLTAAGGLLGGGYPLYGLYEANGGWVAVAALEPHFRERLLRELELDEPETAALAEAFKRRTPQEWEAWAEEHDVPLAAVRGAPRRTR